MSSQLTGRVHVLKTVQPYFNEVWWENKTFEVRKNDRDFKEGDVLILEEYKVEEQKFTGRKIQVYVSYILKNFPAVDKDYVVLGIKIMEKQ